MYIMQSLIKKPKKRKVALHVTGVAHMTQTNRNLFGHKTCVICAVIMPAKHRREGIKCKEKHVCLHAEKFAFRNLVESTRNQIVFTIFRLIWYETDVRLIPNL